MRPSRPAFPTILIPIFLIQLILPPLPAAAVATPEARGDAAWRRRAEGFAASGRVAPEPAARAVAAYEEALAADGDNLRLRFKLIEALYFQAYFTVPDEARRRRLYERHLALCEETLARVEAGVGNSEILAGLPPEPRAARLRGVEGAVEAHFWNAVSWGLWGMSHGSLAAASRGVAREVRDHARVVALLDEGYADGGGLRLLGRLHTVAPRVPFFTGWIDRREGIHLLERALAISEEDPRNAFFLAEALLEYEPARRGEALELLRRLSRRRPAEDHLVEQSETLEQARRALAREEGS